MKLLIAPLLVAVVGCGNFVGPKSGYGVPNAGDPSDTLLKPNGDLGCRSGYNVASGLPCNDGVGFPASGFHAPRGDYKHFGVPVKRSAVECFSGYVVAFGDTTCA